MAITKQILVQYSDLQQECKETRDKINRLEEQIERLEKQIHDIENEGTVKDKVRGGLGGIQQFKIEGFPTKEYNDKKSMLMLKKILIKQRKSTLEVQELKLLEKTNEVEQFMHEVDDSHIRRIINLRFIEGLSWNKVADRVGGGNSEDSVRKMYERYMQNK